MHAMKPQLNIVQINPAKFWTSTFSCITLCIFISCAQYSVVIWQHFIYLDQSETPLNCSVLSINHSHTPRTFIYVLHLHELFHNLRKFLFVFRKYFQCTCKISKTGNINLIFWTVWQRFKKAFFGKHPNFFYPFEISNLKVYII